LKEYERDNAVFSPISIAIVIELYLEGVCSLPVEEITQALHKPSHNATSDTIAFISKAHGASFTEAQMRYFQDHGIDWSPDIDIAAINKLVAEATNHKIENFLQPGPYQNLCYNVLHFKRSWKRNFFDSSEISRPFTSLNHPEGMPPYQVKSIQTDRAETLRCAEVEMPEGRKLDLVAIPCEQVSAQKDMPEMHAVLAIPDTLMTEKTLPLYREALFSSFSELQWSDQLATITMPESTLRTRDENVGRLLAKHPDERVRAAAKEVFPHMITEAYLKCNNRGFEGSAATAQMALCAPSGIARNPRNFSVTGPYFVLIGIYLADGKFLPLMAEQVVKPEGALTLA